VLPLYDTIPSRHPPVAVWFLIGAQVLVFALLIGLPPRELAAALYTFGFVPAQLQLGEAGPYWTLVTCIFLHGGLLHLLSNTWILWIFGDNVEDRMGPARFVAFYLTCGAAAALTELLVHPHSTAPMIGASGAISGVMGAYLVMYPGARIVLLVPLLFWPIFVQVSAVFFLFYWLVLQLISGGLSLGETNLRGGVAYWAHIGGFVAGLVLHRLFLIHPATPHGERHGLEYAWAPPRRSRP